MNEKQRVVITNIPPLKISQTIGVYPINHKLEDTPLFVIDKEIEIQHEKTSCHKFIAVKVQLGNGLVAYKWEEQK